MKYFKFWIKEAYKIKINGATKHINILAGSNISKEDARDHAKKQALTIEQRISSNKRKKDYEVPIKEHVEEIIDDNNIITICRYGAKILNTTDYTILDLDDYAFDFFDIFKAVRKMPKKDRIVFKFLERLKKYPEIGNDFRIYETAKGIRVIGKNYVNPAIKSYQSLMRKFAVDWYYIIMSKKQNCYRARITPKPYRMRIKTIKIRSPLDCETKEYCDWVKNYELSAQKYCVVKHIKSIGRDFSSEPIIRLHDSICKASQVYKLA
ncbi:hypothetical protein CSB45_02020 [candidate division KSB3 bacterium]|uniref:Uncharacterized protein n=1 Tax=candidate division KSB3 bacterium TaxID=2044937 RepID=A0A2G6E9P6_9BACT|nr:MAG: hypothetical protein CSB45_02020 [candidate division KSB3 bacterium]PIE30860.1 MAG: hypothetical protein CSA57_00630 [candidate division KSB3 bacterium]